MPQLAFPDGFTWGVATSSYQIEGAHDEEGRSESVWDRFAHTPGKIIDGSNGDVAVDHYHRWQEDVALMASLGIKAYRFSTAWPRILPQGRGKVNQPGLDFYSRLVDALLEAGIAPYVTLFHWDLPQILEDEGGWLIRPMADAFVEYTDVITRHLGDRVKHWFTHNEPWCTSFLSYELGMHAPGVVGDTAAALKVAHHALLSHGMAIPVIRANSPGAKVGIAPNLMLQEPASPSHADAEATRLRDGWLNRWFLDPIYGRRYPADMVAHYVEQGHLPPGGADFIHEGDFDIIATPTDFLGINYYTREIIRAENAPDNLPPTRVAGPEITEMGWEVYPDGLYQLLNRLHFEYHIPELIVTENGASYMDGPDASGEIHDQKRITYLRDHLAAAHRAIQNGVPLSGYFSWSFMDNFEWSKGYTQRFGMVWVDYETMQRIPKQSAYWYRDTIKANAVTV